MSNKPVWALGYALRETGVPCAEEIAMMLGKKRVPYGYIYDGVVLSKPRWDETAYPIAIMLDNASMLNTTNTTPPTLYVSAVPLTSDEYYCYVNPPYCKASYDLSTGAWGEFTQVTEGEVKVVFSTAMWSNQTIADENGVARLEAYEPEPFYLNDKTTATAFLYGNQLVFQSNSIPESGKTFTAFVGWDTARYANWNKAPWRRISSAIKYVTIDEDVVPAYTDYWFYNMGTLTSATLHGGLHEIGNYMFYKTKLASYNIPEGITRIGDYAYAQGDVPNSMYKKGVTIPASVKYIGERAFYLHDGITAVTMLGVEEIGKYAFNSMSNLGVVRIPATTKRICPWAFTSSGYAGASFYGEIVLEFAATDGWWVSKDPDATEGIAVAVSTDGGENRELFASYMVGNVSTAGTYAGYYLNRNI